MPFIFTLIVRIVFTSDISTSIRNGQASTRKWKRFRFLDFMLILCLDVLCETGFANVASFLLTSAYAFAAGDNQPLKFLYAAEFTVRLLKECVLRLSCRTRHCSYFIETQYYLGHSF